MRFLLCKQVAPFLNLKKIMHIVYEWKSYECFLCQPCKSTFDTIGNTSLYTLCTYTTVSNTPELKAFVWHLQYTRKKQDASREKQDVSRKE